MPTPSWAVVATVKAPQDKVLACVAHHLSIGAAQVFLYFDDPDDLLIMNHWGGHHPPGGKVALCIDAIKKVPILPHIPDQDRLSGLEHLAGDTQRGVELLTDQRIGPDTGCGLENQFFTTGIEQHDGTGLRLHDLGRHPDHGL